MNDSPIEDYLDELLRRTRADARTIRRLLDEVGDHLHATASELVGTGLCRPEAEVEAVRRFGTMTPIVRASHRQSLRPLVLETLRACVFLAGCGLSAVGASGLVALAMNVLAGRSFVGGGTFLGGSGPSVQETADDAVGLRIIAGLVGLVVLLGVLARRHHARSSTVLPPGLVDALGAAAFAAGTTVLAGAAIDQAVRTGSAGVGFALSGAVVALPACLLFCVRAARAILPSPAGGLHPS